MSTKYIKTIMTTAALALMTTGAAAVEIEKRRLDQTPEQAYCHKKVNDSPDRTSQPYSVLYNKCAEETYQGFTEAKAPRPAAGKTTIPVMQR